MARRLFDLALPATRRAAAEARHTAVERLRDALPEQRLEEVELLVSELVSNSIRHAGLREDEAIRVRAREALGSIRIEVFDPGGGFPAPLAPPQIGDGGFGLLLVDCLADRWKVRQTRRGTTVWFEVARGSGRGRPWMRGLRRGPGGLSRAVPG